MLSRLLNSGRWLALVAHIPSVHKPSNSEAERRERYLAFSFRAADRQRPTLLKLAALMQANAQELGSLDAALSSFNARPDIAGTKFVMKEHTVLARASAQCDCV